MEGISLYDRPVTLEELEPSVPYSPFVRAEEVVDHYSGPLFSGAAVAATGAIDDIIIEYDSVNPHLNPKSPVPPGIPLNKSVLVHVWAKNTGDVDIKFRIEWTIWRPDGTPVESYADTELFATPPGYRHEFIGGRFTVDMAGGWTMAITLKRIY